MPRGERHASLPGSRPVTKRPVKDLSASVRHRPMEQARQQSRPFAELLQYFGIERFLYRLSRSAHGDKFVLKGALMLRVWRGAETRPTADIDLLGRTNNQVESIVAI